LKTKQDDNSSYVTNSIKWWRNVDVYWHNKVYNHFVYMHNYIDGLSQHTRVRAQLNAQLQCFVVALGFKLLFLRCIHTNILWAFFVLTHECNISYLF
jgi:hypothetical protein